MESTFMIRTQIYIDEKLHRKLNKLAEAQGKPMAELARNYIEDGVTKAEGTVRSSVATLRAVGSLGFKSRKTDVAGNIDHYLYGAPKLNDAN